MCLASVMINVLVRTITCTYALLSPLVISYFSLLVYFQETVQALVISLFMFCFCSNINELTNFYNYSSFQGQYHDWIKLFEVFSRYRLYVDVSHLRPAFPVLDNPSSWWRYAAQASLQQRKMW